MSEEKMREALAEAEQIAWDEAERQLALYDAGTQTYGHHAAEFIAKAIAALSTKQEAGEVSRSQTAQAMDMRERAAKVAEESKIGLTRDYVRGWDDACEEIAHNIRALPLPAPDAGWRTIDSAPGRYEVTFYDPADNCRKAIGWADDLKEARQLANLIERHPTWTYAQIFDRDALPAPPVGDGR